MKKQVTWVNTQMSKELAKRVRVLAAKKDISRSALVRRAVKSYLTQEEKGHNANG